MSRWTRPGWASVNKVIRDLLAQGETAVYDATEAAFDYLKKAPRPEMTSAVVLTDGEDNRSKVKLEALLAKVKSDADTKTIRVFAIAYGGEADRRILERIAEATQAQPYVSDPRSNFEVFKDIATFFSARGGSLP
jgi:Ca-activated chloride channel homolog